MTEAAETDANEDQGYPFLLVRMVEPSSAGMENLAPHLRERVQTNLKRARHLFRSRTIPLLNSDARLCPGLQFDLSSEVDAAILEGIHDDKALLAVLALPPVSDGGRIGGRIYTRVVGTKEHPKLEIQSAASLLGKHWYRHQEMDLFDAIQLARDLEAARERGKTGADLFKPKPPAPPRR